MVLETYHDHHPDLLWRWARISPEAFDILLGEILQDPVFEGTTALWPLWK